MHCFPDNATPWKVSSTPLDVMEHTFHEHTFNLLLIIPYTMLINVKLGKLMHYPIMFSIFLTNLRSVWCKYIITIGWRGVSVSSHLIHDFLHSPTLFQYFRNSVVFNPTVILNGFIQVWFREQPTTKHALCEVMGWLQPSNGCCLANKCLYLWVLLYDAISVLVAFTSCLSPIINWFQPVEWLCCLNRILAVHLPVPLKLSG